MNPYRSPPRPDPEPVDPRPLQEQFFAYARTLPEEGFDAWLDSGAPGERQDPRLPYRYPRHPPRKKQAMTETKGSVNE